MFNGGIPDIAVRGGREIGGIPGIDILDIGGKLGILGKLAAGRPTTRENYSTTTLKHQAYISTFQASNIISR